MRQQTHVRRNGLDTLSAWPRTPQPVAAMKHIMDDFNDQTDIRHHIVQRMRAAAPNARLINTPACYTKWNVVDLKHCDVCGVVSNEAVPFGHKDHKEMKTCKNYERHWICEWCLYPPCGGCGLRRTRETKNAKRMYHWRRIMLPGEWRMCMT